MGSIGGIDMPVCESPRDTGPVEQELTLLRQNLDRAFQTVEYLDSRLSSVLSAPESVDETPCNPASGMSSLTHSVHMLVERVDLLGAYISSISRRVEL